MKRSFNKALALIGEGPTELVFYEEYFKALASSNQNYSFAPLNVVGEAVFCFNSYDQNTLVKMHSTNTVSQLPNASSWFYEFCNRPNPNTPWTVVLAYDTDNYLSTVTRFHKGEWLRLRSNLNNYAASIVDMAASADIEDLMLLDYPNVLKYIGLPPNTPLPSGGKGKAKMKKLFRLKALNYKYREGERARPLIQSLDMDLIERTASLPFPDLRVALGI